MAIRIILISTLLAFLLVGYTQASTLTVCPSGCDYTSIQTAVYAAHPNDTIEAHSGTYNESVVLTKNIMFKGIDTGSGEPIVNGDLYQNGFNMVLHGFSFQSVSSGIPDAENMTTPNTTIYWIEKAFANPSTPKAIAALDNILKTNPKDAWAWFELGMVLSNSRRYDESIGAFNESIKLDPYFCSAWDLKGLDFYSLNKYDNALEAYEKAIQLDLGNGLYWNDKGDALKALGRTTESDAAYARASELGYGGSTSGTTTISPSATPVTHILDHSMASNVDESTNSVITRTNTFSSTDSKAYSWLSLGNVGAGRVEWMWYSPNGNLYKTISFDIPPNTSGGYWSSYNIWSYLDIAGDKPADLPGNWHVDVYLGSQKLLTEEFSIQGYQQPNGQTTEEYWFDQGNALMDQKKYYEAIQAFDKSIEIDPQHAATWNNKGLALMHQDKNDEAIQAYEKAIEIDPQLAEAWYNKGIALDNQGKYKEAIQAYDRATEIDPQNADAWGNKGSDLNVLGKNDEAVQAYDKAIKIKPTNANYWSNKGVALDDQKKYDEAIQAYEKAIEIDPQFTIAWNNKGVTLRNQGKYDEAIQAFDKAIEIDPGDANAWNNKGRALKLLGKTSESDAAFAKAKELGYKG